MSNLIQITDTHENVTVYFDEMTEKYYLNPRHDLTICKTIKLIFKGFLNHKIINELKQGKPLSAEFGMYK